MEDTPMAEGRRDMEDTPVAEGRRRGMEDTPGRRRGMEDTPMKGRGLEDISMAKGRWDVRDTQVLTRHSSHGHALEIRIPTMLAQERGEIPPLPSGEEPPLDRTLSGEEDVTPHAGTTQSQEDVMTISGQQVDSFDDSTLQFTTYSLSFSG